MISIFKREYMIEAYGKLPFYKDYINVVTSQEASSWQEWMLKIFGQENIIIPQGIWHFVFSSSKDSHLITGIIVQSSDGLRKFPFSLFVNLGASGISNDMKWAEIFYIRDCLKNAYQELQSVSDINSCYTLISGIPLVIRKREIKSNYLKSVNRPNLNLLNKGKINDFPVFSIVSEGDVACLSCGSFSGEDIISKWNLAMYGPMVRVAK